jgi:hypothetical protein
MIFFERIHCGIPTVDDPMLNTPWSNNYGIPVAWHTTQTIFLSFSIVALGNFLVIASQLKGVTVTIRLIRSLSAWFPLETGRIDDYSMHTDRLIKKWPFLFLCHKQICLIRGLLLFFWHPSFLTLHFWLIRSQKYQTADFKQSCCLAILGTGIASTLL